MKIVKCPLCKSADYSILYKSTLTKRDFRPDVIVKNLKNTLDDYRKHGQIVKCRGCTLVYVNPQEDILALMKGYEQVIDKDYLETESYRKILSKQHLQTVEKYMKKGKMLDVGCFVGFFLQLAKNNGWEVYGVEPSSWAIKEAKKRKIRIIGKVIDDIRTKKYFFDVITLWDVIEHLPNPHSTLTNIHALLKKGGIIALGTPNIESLFYAKVLRGNCPFLVRMHVILYSPQTLSLLLNKYGFEVIEVQPYSRTFPVYYLLERIRINNRLFNTCKRILKKITFLMNLQITLPFNESFVMIARKK